MCCTSDTFTQRTLRTFCAPPAGSPEAYRCHVRDCRLCLSQRRVGHSIIRCPLWWRSSIFPCCPFTSSYREVACGCVRLGYATELPNPLLSALFHVQGRCCGHCRSASLAADFRRVPPLAFLSIASRGFLITFFFSLLHRFLSFVTLSANRAPSFPFLFRASATTIQPHERCTCHPFPPSLLPLPTRLCLQTISIHARMLGSTPSKNNDEGKRDRLHGRTHVTQARYDEEK